MICDLEQVAVIDLLPDREAKTVAEWFKAHPTVEIVTRDRSKTYAAGVAEGAPQAIQVADRWHLASNLVDALETTLAKHPSRLRGAPLQVESVSTEKQKPAKTEVHPTLQADQLAISDAKRTLRKQQYDQVIALRQQGVFAADIAKHVGLGKRTVHRWLAHGSFPERKKRATQPTKIDPYRPYIHQRWQEGCQNLAQIYREIQALGYKGGRHAIYSQCQELRQTQARVQPPDSLLNNLKQTTRRYSPRQVAFLFIKPPDELRESQKVDLEMILDANPQFTRWRALAQQFMQLLRERDRPAFDAWLSAVAQDGSGAMKRFAAGLRSDYAEVAAALTYEWSNGPTEGHVNRLKLLKRQMFGRAKLDLLRKRVMYRH